MYGVADSLTSYRPAKRQRERAEDKSWAQHEITSSKKVQLSLLFCLSVRRDRSCLVCGEDRSTLWRQLTKAE